MHILLVSHYTLPHSGGIEVLVEQMGRTLVRQGHTVTVVSSRTGAAAEEERAGVRIIRVAAWNFLERFLHVPYPLFAPTLLPILRRAVSGADVVHVHGFLYLGSWCALLWAWWLNKPIVVTEHVGWVPYRNPFLNWIQRLALALTARLFLRRADAVITYNSAVRDWLTRLTPYPERMHFVRNGIDTEQFHPPSAQERAGARHQLGLPADRPIALFVGRFVEKKGLDVLLGMRNGGFDLLLCGRGELPTDMASSVHVLRDVEHDRMPQVYHAADVFVLPSRGEGFPVAIMEAMASGLPVVAAQDQTYDAYVSDREMLQTVGDANSLSAALTSLLANDADRRRRAQAARERAVRDLSLAASVVRHLDIYEQARGFRRLATALAPLSYDLPTRLKVPVLRDLVGQDPPLPRAEVGPGSGFGAHHVFGPGTIIAIDISRGNLQALKQRASDAGNPGRFAPVQADLAALPFRNGTLGTILCTEVLEHLADDCGAAAQLERVLAPRGRLVVEVPNITRGYASYLELLGVQTVHDVPGPEFHHRRGYTPETLAGLFEPLGMRVTQDRTFLGRLGLLLMDSVAAVHLVYERLRFGRSAWTWSDVYQLTDSPIFRLYRLLFPLLRTLARLDAVFSRKTGFILGVRLEKTLRGTDGAPGQPRPQSR